MGLTSASGKVLTASEAARDVQDFQKSTNTRIVHPMKPWIVEARKKKVHVINVGPWAHTVWAGSYGSFHIPACPKGVPYAEMLVDEKDEHGRIRKVPPISAVQLEQVIKNEVEMEEQSEDGYRFAWELLGEGRGQNQAYSLRHKGCLVIAGDEPTEEELLEARLELEEECRRLVSEARELAAMNDPIARKGIVKGVHDLAAEVLNLTDEDWLVARNPEGRQKCKICGTLSDAGVLKCPTSGCGYIFDPSAYAAILAEQEAAIEAAKPKKAK